MERREGADRFVEHNPWMVEDFLKLSEGFASMKPGQICHSAITYGIQAAVSEFIRSGCLEELDGLCGNSSLKVLSESAKTACTTLENEQAHG